MGIGDVIQHYGLIGIVILLALGIVGLPLPDETILTAVGYMVYRRELPYLPSVLAGMVGAILGITLSYAAGAWLGKPLLQRVMHIVHKSERSISRTSDQMERYGSYLLFFGYFIPGVRHVTAILAGMTRMSFGRFALFAYTGACVWVICFITLGHLAGPRIEQLRTHLSSPLLYTLTACVALAFVTGALYRRARAK
ncbi:hypothetical protein AYW79_00555 [Ferroacidibacillus organovorans]|uniref:VTT domain-containing protein n=1 Tax=Ferroacidibacillus organovorans TaxID=1765683 RepID=A0A853KE57_9BACL|nr:DedA family protein [Ferroacidibacillus organovorans]OAG95435.1 hypothetical protein AYW79_00555 [Ferroacidibacillus organovorans]